MEYANVGSLFAKHLNARRAVRRERGKIRKKRENCANPLKKCLKISCILLGFLFLFSFFPFCSLLFVQSTQREMKLNDSSTAPTPRMPSGLLCPSSCCKIMLKSKITANIRVAIVVFSVVLCLSLGLYTTLVSAVHAVR